MRSSVVWIAADGAQRCEHALDQHVAFHQRQLGQAGHRHGARPVVRAAAQFLYRLPFQPQRRVAALQPCPGWPPAHACWGRASRGWCPAHRPAARVAGVPACRSCRPAGSGVRRSCDTAASSELRSFSDSMLTSACCATDIMQALERDGDQRGVGFDLTPRFGIGEQAARRGQRRRVRMGPSAAGRAARCWTGWRCRRRRPWSHCASADSSGGMSSAAGEAS